MMITAVPSSRVRRVSSSRIWAWMVTSRAVVGSWAGVQGRHRLLEDHGDLVAADVPDLVLVHLDELFALEVDGAGDDLAGRHRYQAEDGEGGDGVAATAFAHEAEG